MFQQNRTPKHISPQKLLQSTLRAVVSQASRQKLLPKIMWKADKEYGSKKLIKYQKQVHRQYDNDLKSPMKYDPEAAKSERQKFRQKVLKLVNNQLQIDYFENKKLKDRTAVTYKGHQIEVEKVQTKKQFQLFQNFNQKKFKETYSNIFDDKLQVGYQNLYHNRKNKRSHTLHILDSKVKTQPLYLKTEESQPNIRSKKTQTSYFQLPKTSRKKNLLLDLGQKKVALLHFNEKKTIGKELPHNQQIDIIRIMRQIGGFSRVFKEGQLSLTRESINRWLKGLYQKQHRIVDFLEIKNVVSYEQFFKISKRLRVMPQEHLLFLTFLYYDGNNDGYICDYDLERMANLSLKRPLIAQDHKKLKQSNIKKVLSTKPPYLELYRLSQITQTIYFDWKNKQEDTGDSTYQVQIKNRLLSSRQKQIFLDFQSFSSIYKFQKPFLWYDLMNNLGGVCFQGLRYEK